MNRLLYEKCMSYCSKADSLSSNTYTEASFSRRLFSFKKGKKGKSQCLRVTRKHTGKTGLEWTKVGNFAVKVSFQTVLGAVIVVWCWGWRQTGLCVSVINWAWWVRHREEKSGWIAGQSWCLFFPTATVSLRQEKLSWFILFVATILLFWPLEGCLDQISAVHVIN